MACALRTSVILTASLCLCACSAAVPVRVARIGGELFFVLDGAPQVESVTVTREASPWRPAEKMWFAGCAAIDDGAPPPPGAKADPLKGRCRVHQIKYGDGGTSLPSIGPALPLSRGTDYSVRVDIAGSGAAEAAFAVEGENSVSMPEKPAAARGFKGVTLETDSGELFYPYEVSASSEAGRVVLTAGSPRTVVRARKKPAAY